MSLNNIQLTPNLLSDLYTKVLVELPPAVLPEVSVVSYLGGNVKNIVLVVNNAEATYLTDEQTLFLTSILSACKLTLNDVAILNFASLSFPPDQAIMELKAKSVLLFDVPPTDFELPIHFPHYQLQPFKECTYLSAPSLSILEADVTQKKAFWNSLKKLFVL